ncbi:zinc finger protein 771-like [Eumetopias jubatus]|uniref:zinc finger protein 771-like n=1 Tax=Eumetopias jubatus TaxID=34886 RepID=UPI001016D059|nr:zinc finger protein 771-like [Eumetopias jubatus]
MYQILQPHKAQKRFRSEECGRAFRQSSGPAQHCRTDLRKRFFACDACGKALGQSSQLTRHQRTHTGERPYWSSMCCKGFSQRTNLRQHQSAHTGDGTLGCGACGKAFTLNARLGRHQHTHTAGKPHPGRHPVTHTAERPHVCPDCGRTFGQRANLPQHWNAPGGERPYECGQGGQRFSRSSDLLQQVPTDGGEKPYPCPVRGRAFSQPANLCKHRRTHSGAASAGQACDRRTRERTRGSRQASTGSLTFAEFTPGRPTGTCDPPSPSYEACNRVISSCSPEAFRGQWLCTFRLDGGRRAQRVDTGPAPGAHLHCDLTQVLLHGGASSRPVPWAHSTAGGVV